MMNPINLCSILIGATQVSPEKEALSGFIFIHCSDAAEATEFQSLVKKYGGEIASGVTHKFPVTKPQESQ